MQIDEQTRRAFERLDLLGEGGEPKEAECELAASDSGLSGRVWGLFDGETVHLAFVRCQVEAAAAAGSISAAGGGGGGGERSESGGAAESFWKRLNPFNWFASTARG